MDEISGARQNLKTSENYKQLPSATAQHVLKQVDNNWKSYFNAIKEWKEHPEKFEGMPKIPGYKKKDGENILIFTNQQCRIKNGILKFPKPMNM